MLLPTDGTGGVLAGASFLLLFAVLQGADIRHLAEHAAEVGGAGKAGLLGNSADGKLGGLQQLLRRLDAAVVQVVHDGLPGHPPEQAAEIVRGKVEPRRYLGKRELLPVPSILKDNLVPFLICRA